MGRVKDVVLQERWIEEIEEERIRDPKFVHEENRIAVENYHLRQELSKMKEFLIYTNMLENYEKYKIQEEL